MKKYSNYIAEVFNTTYSYKFLKYEDGAYHYSFNTPTDIIYVYFQEISTFPYDAPNTYAIGFTAGRNIPMNMKPRKPSILGGTPSILTNDQDPFKVFATVIAIAYNEYDKLDIEHLYVDVENDFPGKRYDLYLRIVKRFQPRYNYEITTPFQTRTGILITL